MPEPPNRLQAGKAFQEKLGNQERENQPHPADDPPRKTQNKINQHINKPGCKRQRSHCFIRITYENKKNQHPNLLRYPNFD